MRSATATCIIVCVVILHGGQLGHTKEVRTKLLTKAKARSLASNPAGLVKTALQLMRMRRRRSIDFNDGNVANKSPEQNERDKRSLIETSHQNDEDAHVIDKREIPSSVEEEPDTEDMDSGGDEAAEQSDETENGIQLQRRRRNLDENDSLTLSKKHYTNGRVVTLQQLLGEILPLLKGRDGRDGRDGQNGRDGLRGEPGPPGPPGPGLYASSGHKGSPHGEQQGEHHHTIRLRPGETHMFNEKTSAHVTSLMTTKLHFHDGQVITFWSSDSLTSHLSGGIKLFNGCLKIPEEGLYFVYCQLHFLQASSTTVGFEVLVNGRNALSKVTKPGEASYTGGLLHLASGSVLSVRVLGHGNIEGDHSMNFFGVYTV